MAISRSELHIGSQVQHGRILELRQEEALVELFNGTHQRIKYADLMPLPLTTGYLIIAGFEQQHHGWHRPGLFLLQEDAGWYMRQDNRYVTNNPIATVHHLQNLYQALTGHNLPNTTNETEEFTQSN